MQALPHVHVPGTLPSHGVAAVERLQLPTGRLVGQGIGIPAAGRHPLAVLQGLQHLVGHPPVRAPARRVPQRYGDVDAVPRLQAVYGVIDIGGIEVALHLAARELHRPARIPLVVLRTGCRPVPQHQGTGQQQPHPSLLHPVNSHPPGLQASILLVRLSRALTRGGAALSLSRPEAARLWRLSESAALLPFLAAAACSWRLPGSAALFLFLLRPSAPGIRPARPEASASLSYLSRSVPSPATSTSTPQALLMALWALWVCTASTSASTTKVAPS